MPKDYLDPICNIRYSCQKLYSKKTKWSETYVDITVPNTRKQPYAEYGAKLKNFHSSNLLCVCPSLFATNLDKAKYSIYEKLSTVFSVAGFRFEGNKTTNSSASNIPFSVALKAFVLIYYSTFLKLSSHSHGRVV